jgi:hypothetical protein
VRLSHVYGWSNRFPSGFYLATTDISIKDYRAAALRRWGGDPNEPHYAAADFAFTSMHHLHIASGLYGQRLYPPKDESNMEERCYKWKKSHVKIEKVDEDTIRLSVSGDTAEEAEDSLKHIMDLYRDRFARLQKDLPEAFRWQPTCSGKATISKL